MGGRQAIRAYLLGPVVVALALAVACSAGSPAQPLVNVGLVHEDEGELCEAVERYTEAIALDSTYVPAYRQRAEAYIGRGQHLLAIQDFTHILSLDEEDVRALVGRGRAYTAFGRLDRALRDLDAALDIERQNTDALLARATTLTAAEEPNKALQDLKQYIELIPDNPEAYFLLGESFLAVSQIELSPRPATTCRRGTACSDAIDAFGEVIKLDPDYPGVHLRRGIAYRNSGSMEEALESLQMAIQADPRSAKAHLELGRARLESGDPMAALLDLRRAIKLPSRDPLEYLSRGWAYLDLDRPLPALQDFHEAARLDPKNPVFRTSRGIAYMAVGWHEKAIGALNDSLSLRSDDPEVLLLRGEAHYALGDLQRAMNDFDAALGVDRQRQPFYELDKRDEVDMRAHYHLAWSNVEQGDLEAAAKSFDAAREFDQDGTHDPIDKGARYRSLGLLGGGPGAPARCGGDFDCNAALRSAFEELMSEPSSAPAHMEVARVMVRLGLIDLAEERFKAALAAGESDPTTLLSIGNVYLAGGQPAEAATYFETAVAGQRQHAESQLLLGTAYRWMGQSRRESVWYAECQPDAECDDAVAALTSAIELDPGLREAYVQRASVHLNRARPDLAVIDLNRAVDLDPHDASAFVDRGNAYMELGLHSRALEDFSEAIRLQRRLGPAYGYRVLVHTTLGADFLADRDILRAVNLGVDETRLRAMVEAVEAGISDQE